ncbi:hypothetical protein GCM10009765_20530 [Fodinicola feengrottensis]|uniref:Uncharacterized protein n=1 Tax=Fodinicola feengrottensis TaxID=435914 RepID=A0ABP4SFT0_9ACTN
MPAGDFLVLSEIAGLGAVTYGPEVSSSVEPSGRGPGDGGLGSDEAAENNGSGDERGSRYTVN